MKRLHTAWDDEGLPVLVSDRVHEHQAAERWARVLWVIVVVLLAAPGLWLGATLLAWMMAVGG